MNRKRKWEKIAVIVPLAVGLILFGMGVWSFYSATRHIEEAGKAMAETLGKEQDLLDEIRTQITWQESHPEYTTLSHAHFLAIVLDERDSFYSQMKVLMRQSEASADFAKSAFFLAGVGGLGAVTVWFSAFPEKIKKPRKKRLKEVR